MAASTGLMAAAALFKLLSSESRLELLQLLAGTPLSVSELAARTGMSQPLVSQHLRTLRQGGIVSVSRAGREAHYRLADDHITHVVEDAVAHVLEEEPHRIEPITALQGEAS